MYVLQFHQNKIRQSVIQNKELPKHLFTIDLTKVFYVQTMAQQSGFWESCIQKKQIKIIFIARRRAFRTTTVIKQHNVQQIVVVLPNLTRINN